MRTADKRTKDMREAERIADRITEEMTTSDTKTRVVRGIVPDIWQFFVIQYLAGYLIRSV